MLRKIVIKVSNSNSLYSRELVKNPSSTIALTSLTNGMYSPNLVSGHALELVYVQLIGYEDYIYMYVHWYVCKAFCFIFSRTF